MLCSNQWGSNTRSLFPLDLLGSKSLGYGVKEQVDWSQEGLTAKVTRTIVENGETRTEVMTSKYEPWRAVYLYGPGAVVPVTPTPLPRTDEITTSVEGELDDPVDDVPEAESDSSDASVSDGASDAVTEQLVELPTATTVAGE